MKPNTANAAWLIDPNLSAGDVPEALLQNVDLVEVSVTITLILPFVIGGGEIA